MKKIMVVLSATLLLWGCSDNNNKVEEGSVKEEKIEVVEEKEETVVEEVEEEEYSREDRISVVSASMSESYSGVAEIEYNSSADTLTILPTDEDFILAMVYTMKGHEKHVKSWNELVKSLSEQSITVSKIVDEDISIAVLNPENSDKVFLLVQNGFVLYNFVDDI